MEGNQSEDLCTARSMPLADECSPRLQDPADVNPTSAPAVSSTAAAATGPAADTHSVESKRIFCLPKLHITTTGILCLQGVYGFIAGFKPAEAFVVPFMIGKGITLDQINDVVFPTSSYAMLAFFAALTLLSVFVPFTWLLYLSWAGYVVCYFTLAYGRTLTDMVVTQVFYGLVLASETIYCSSFFFFADPRIFGRVAAISRICMLSAHLLADLIAQLLTSYKPGLDPASLFLTTAVCSSLTLVPLLFLPLEGHTAAHPRRLCKKVGAVWTARHLCQESAASLVFTTACEYLVLGYASNILYEIHTGGSTPDSLYGWFVMCGRVGGILGSTFGGLFTRLRWHSLYAPLGAALAAACGAMALPQTNAPAFVLFTLQYMLCECANTLAWTDIAAAHPPDECLTLFLVLALFSTVVQVVVQATVFSAFGTALFGLSSSRTHFFWLAVLMCAGVLVCVSLAIARAVGARGKKAGACECRPDGSGTAASETTAASS